MLDYNGKDGRGYQPHPLPHTPPPVRVLRDEVPVPPTADAKPKVWDTHKLLLITVLVVSSSYLLGFGVGALLFLEL
jgi:hypothetical protein